VRFDFQEFINQNRSVQGFTIPELPRAKNWTPFKIKTYKQIQQQGFISYFKILKNLYHERRKKRYQKRVSANYLLKQILQFKRILGFSQDHRLSSHFNFLTPRFFLKTEQTSTVFKQFYRKRRGVYTLIVLIQRIFKHLYAQTNLRYT